MLFINYLYCYLFLINFLGDENKVIKLNLDNSDSLIKECAKIQTNLAKQNRQLKESVNKKNEEIYKVN